jgi:hypothetical protein
MILLDRLASREEPRVRYRIWENVSAPVDVCSLVRDSICVDEGLLNSTHVLEWRPRQGGREVP